MSNPQNIHVTDFTRNRTLERAAQSVWLCSRKIIYRRREHGFLDAGSHHVLRDAAQCGVPSLEKVARNALKIVGVKLAGEEREKPLTPGRRPSSTRRGKDLRKPKTQK